MKLLSPGWRETTRKYVIVTGLINVHMLNKQLAMKKWRCLSKIRNVAVIRVLFSPSKDPREQREMIMNVDENQRDQNNRVDVTCQAAASDDDDDEEALVL